MGEPRGRRPGRRWLGIAVLTALTIVHAGFRWLAAGERDPAPVSTLPLGSGVENAAVRETDGRTWEEARLLDAAAPCQILVAFDPACPHCARAADTEREQTTTSRLPTTWFSRELTEGERRYAHRVGARSRVVHAPGAWETLQVRAVPAAFLLDSHRSVRRIWPYRGTLGRRELAPYCQEDEGSPATGVSGSR